MRRTDPNDAIDEPGVVTAYYVSWAWVAGVALLAVAGSLGLLL